MWKVITFIGLTLASVSVGAKSCSVDPVRPIQQVVEHVKRDVLHIALPDLKPCPTISKKKIAKKKTHHHPKPKRHHTTLHHGGHGHGKHKHHSPHPKKNPASTLHLTGPPNCS